MCHVIIVPADLKGFDFKQRHKLLSRHEMSLTCWRPILRRHKKRFSALSTHTRPVSILPVLLSATDFPLALHLISSNAEAKKKTDKVKLYNKQKRVNKWRTGITEIHDPFHFSMRYDLLNCIYSTSSHPLPLMFFSSLFL